jgi:hypothetical protein
LPAQNPDACIGGLYRARPGFFVGQSARRMVGHDRREIVHTEPIVLHLRLSRKRSGGIIIAKIGSPFVIGLISGHISFPAL